MIVTDHERYLNLHGEQAARLNRHQSIHQERHRSRFIKIMSPFLLYGPENHLRKLVKISVDSIVNKSSWFQYLQKLTDEWKELTLYVHITFVTHQRDRSHSLLQATVLLNANVAFLAIQSVDNAATTGHRSNAQRASYFSIVTSIAAIILGLLLVRQHHTTLTVRTHFHLVISVSNNVGCSQVFWPTEVSLALGLKRCP